MEPLHPLEAHAIRFPDGVYSDVRLERTADHQITLRDGHLDQVVTKVETGALVRVLKGGRWYIASTTDLDAIDDVLAELAASDALPPTDRPSGIAALEVIDEAVWAFDDARIDAVPVADKLALLQHHARGLERPSVRTWVARWIDQHRDRRFVSSRGANVRHDYQECGFILSVTMADGESTVSERFSRADHRFDALAMQRAAHGESLVELLDKCERFARDAVSVEPGEHTVILAPEVAGVFAHESFGHKSEADFMLGDPAMLDEWKIGAPVASKMVSIVDSGRGFGSGYMPFDDEGQRSTETHLIRDGVLAGRLHSSMTAAALGEAPTANSRAISFRYEPIVRMTTTTIGAGDQSRQELFDGVDDGYFIETVKHGSGMSTFTIAPGLCWRIRGGRLAEPVRVAVMTGSVFETLGEIDGLSNAVETPFLVGGGCGKMEQWPLSVSFGGPHVRIRRMSLA
ncbi:MAG: TldD/PmbA family protein [Myxococcota bacterium]|nr:TldD/PmbA family protein [Myxococcota bacterium]